MIEIVRPGLLTTVQDLGRPGYAHLGVARSGALDAPSLIRANHLVGNPDGAAALETTDRGDPARRSPTVVGLRSGGARRSTKVQSSARRWRFPRVLSSTSARRWAAVLRGFAPA
jgi:allophanate hydrolase subunit 2